MAVHSCRRNQPSDLFREHDVLPFLLVHGIHWVLLAGAAVSVVGLVVTIWLGEETAGRSLNDTSTGAIPVAPASRTHA